MSFNTLNRSYFSELTQESCIFSTITVAIEVALGTTLLVLMYASYWRTAGILEWIITILGAFWIWTFMGLLRMSIAALVRIINANGYDFRVPEDETGLSERDTLLGDC